MNSDTLLAIAAVGAVGVGGLIAWRLSDPNRQRVPYAPAQPVVPPGSQPVQPPALQPVPTTPASPVPNTGGAYPTPTPSPTPTVTKGQLCADLKAQLQKVQSLAEDVQKKMDALVAEGSSADTICRTYAKLGACFFNICSEAFWDSFNACMDYVKGLGPRPGNLFNYADAQALDAAAKEYAKLKQELDLYQSQIDSLRNQLKQLAVEGVVC